MTGKYYVTFDANDGSGKSSSQAFIQNKQQTLTKNAFTRNGYTFKGWALNKTAANKDYSDEQLLQLSANITLYAVWEAETYTITYKDKGNVTFNGVNEPGYPTTHTYGTSTTLDTPTRKSYIFGGYYTDSSCTGTKITALSATGYTSAITLYAAWEEINISQITAEIADITEDNVTSDDKNSITTVLGKLTQIKAEDLESADVPKLTDAKTNCQTLLNKIDEVAKDLTDVSDGFSEFEVDTFTYEDLLGLQDLSDKAQALDEGNNLTAAERTDFNDVKNHYMALANRISDVFEALMTDNIVELTFATDDYCSVDQLEAAKGAIVDYNAAMETYPGNLTSDQITNLNSEIRRVEGIIAVLEPAKEVQDAFDKLPSVEKLTWNDKEAVDAVVKAYEALSENSKNALPEEFEEELTAIKNASAKLEVPKTGDREATGLWIMLMILAGAAMTIVLVSGKKYE